MARFYFAPHVYLAQASIITQKVSQTIVFQLLVLYPVRTLWLRPYDGDRNVTSVPAVAQQEPRSAIQTMDARLTLLLLLLHSVFVFDQCWGK